MVTPLIMLTLLVLPYSSWCLWLSLTGQDSEPAKFTSTMLTGTAGSIGVCAVFCFTGVGHFIATESMIEMMPDFVPFRWWIVISSGIFEVGIGLAILPTRFRLSIGWAIVVFLIAILPLNVYAAANEIGPGGHQWGPVYLLIRVPLQIILIAWTWWFAIRKSLKR